MKTLSTLAAGMLLLVLLSCQTNTPDTLGSWPETTTEAKPWTRWWWHGSAVTKEGITSELESFQKAGLGGVEITPIFGVRGTEDQFVQFLSDEWVDLLIHTLKEAERLGMGVDMATGTGWPFGGPWIQDSLAAKYLAHKTYTLQGGESLKEAIEFDQIAFVRGAGGRLTVDDIRHPISDNDNLQDLAIDQVRFPAKLPFISLMAYSDGGDIVDLTENVTNGQLDWTAPAGEWTLYALFQGYHGKMVERAAPGGEGLVMDHFSAEALEGYLAKFDEAFAGKDITPLRAFFNDSYEVDDARGQADWTPGFFEAFETQNGYDLRTQLPALFGQADPETNARVLSDYRATIEQLLYEHFTKHWKDWAAANGAIIRNQAHGSPANILDLYATVDIPETEGTEILKIKFASSAANVMGKSLTSSESATWLKDHFQSSLSDVKQNLERYFLGGVNHVFYHGTAYSPDTAAWPGWLFYAAIHANDRNPWWHDFATLNQYVTRVQSFLQSTQPDNDILLYFPVYDRYAEGGHGLLEHFDIRGNFYKSEVKAVGEELWNKGYTFDLISDRQVQDLTVGGQEIISHGNRYHTILVPATEYLPLETMQALKRLSDEGATVLFHKHLPQNVPGMGNLDERQAELEALKEAITATSHVEETLETLLSHASLSREPLLDLGLQTIRKRTDGGHVYFIANWTDKTIDQMVPLAKAGSSAMLFDAMTGASGVAQTEPGKVKLQLKPGESIIVRTTSGEATGEPFSYWEATGKTVSVSGPWTVEYVQGGPFEADAQTLTELSSWTTWSQNMAAFSGTVSYSTTFDLPEGSTKDWMLDLGEVHESAVVYVNGDSIATLLGPEYSVVVPAENLQASGNQLRVEATNLMANRIIWMDKNGLVYRKFYNTNFPAHDAENRDPATGLFHADHWEPFPSGLIGPVKLEQ